MTCRQRFMCIYLSIEFVINKHVRIDKILLAKMPEYLILLLRLEAYHQIIIIYCYFFINLGQHPQSNIQLIESSVCTQHQYQSYYVNINNMIVYVYFLSKSQSVKSTGRTLFCLDALDISFKKINMMIRYTINIFYDKSLFEVCCC